MCTHKNWPAMICTTKTLTKNWLFGLSLCDAMKIQRKEAFWFWNDMLLWKCKRRERDSVKNRKAVHPMPLYSCRHGEHRLWPLCIEEVMTCTWCCACVSVWQKWLKPGGKVLISDYCCSEGPHSDKFKAYVKQRGYHLLSPAAYGKVQLVFFHQEWPQSSFSLLSCCHVPICLEQLPSNTLMLPLLSWWSSRHVFRNYF